MTESLLLLGSYLLGAVPFGLLYSWLLRGEDVREGGSGNIGATNILRMYGWLPGLVTLLLDAAKGALPAAAGQMLFPGDPVFWILPGATAVLGHVYPVYTKFSGGKGVATSAGVFTVLTPIPMLGALTAFGLGVGLTRYMSVGSLLGSLALPLLASYQLGTTHPVVLGTWVLAGIVYWTHRGNIRRLYNGTENRFF